MTEGYIERMNLKALSEKDNDQLGTIVKEAYMSGMNTSQRAIFDHVDATLSMITKIARSLGVSTRKIFDLYLEVGKKGFLSKKVARQFASLGFPVFSEISLNTDVSVEEVNQAIIDEKISVSQVEKALASFLEKGAGRKSPCDNCRNFYDNEYGSCAFGCSKLREFTLSEMLSKFTPEEALKIAYLPIVLTQAAFRFATAVADECAQRQLDYKKPVREIRAHTKEYIRNIIGGDKTDLINSLENQVCAFLGKAGNDVQTLYFCINSELKKEYPHLTEHNLLTNIYICQALCTYVREKEMHYDQLIRMRLSAPYHSTVNKDALAVCKALQEIAGNYKISIHTRIINTAVKVIGIKIDNMNFNCD